MAAFVWAAAVTGNWSVGSNWQVGGVPQAAPPTTSDTVTFGAGTVTMSWTNVGAAQSWVIGAVAIKQVVASTNKALGLLGVG